MLRAGIDIYFDPKGEKNKNIDLEFPLRKAEQTSYNNGTILLHLFKNEQERITSSI